LRDAPNQQIDCAWFIRICEDAARYCNSVGFEHSSLKAFTMMTRYKNLSWTLNSSEIQAEFRGLEDDIILDMVKHKFVQVDSKLSGFFENKDLLGTGTSEPFPSASRDILEAGNCLALGLNTASVFHLMHVVEWGLRAFSTDLGLLEVSAGKNKTPVPIEYAQWEQILDQLSAKIKGKIATIPKGPDKQHAQEFYYSAKEEIEAFKEAWRNHVSHTRRSYTFEDAIGVLSHVKRFMQKLADNGIREIPEDA
jgi:hypothetical protein